jgi:hypothetical protein
MSKEINVVAIAAEIADEWLHLVINEYAYTTADNGDQYYTEKAQDLFNEINDHVTGIIEENMYG